MTSSTELEAETTYNCPCCDEMPVLVHREDDKVGIYCANDDCEVMLEVKGLFDLPEEAEKAWDKIIGDFYQPEANGF